MRAKARVGPIFAFLLLSRAVASASSWAIWPLPLQGLFPESGPSLSEFVPAETKAIKFQLLPSYQAWRAVQASA